MVATDLTDFRLRRAGMEDLPALRDVFRRSSLSNEGDRASLLAHPDALEFSDRAVADGRVRAAVIDDRIVGFATVLVTGQIGELEDLFVDPDWVRRGIATALVLDALANAREREVARIEVTANGHALAFYESVGFVWDGMSQTQFGRGFRMHVDIPLSSSGAPAVDRSSRADQVHGVPVSTSSTARWEAVSSGLITDFASVADAMADRSWLRSSGSPGIVGTVIYETYLIG